LSAAWPLKKRLLRFAHSISASIDPRRPYKLTTKQLDSINDLPRVQELQDLILKRKKALHLFSKEEKKYKCEK
jgi:hypothetical protein